METIVRGLRFAEGPRWKDGALWFSDMHDNAVKKTTFEPEPKTETVVRIEGDFPSGLGWLPTGELLVVAMESRCLLAYDGSQLRQHADLSEMGEGDLNDMVVSESGNAYVGNMGYKVHTEGGMQDRRSAETFLVSASGQISAAGEPLQAPNGHILTPDEKTLIVAESAGSRLSAFDVNPADGTLSNLRIFAQLPPAEGQQISAPDGICLDAEGAVWVAEVLGRRVIRVAEGGEVLEEHLVDKIPVACVLGGENRQTLFVCAADDYRREYLMQDFTGVIYAIEALIPGAGKP